MKNPLKINKVSICSIPHKIEYVNVINEETEGIVRGYIEYNKATIYIKKGLPAEIEKETLIHEILHGIFHHNGRYELRDDEEFIQALANDLLQSFDIKSI